MSVIRPERLEGAARLRLRSPHAWDAVAVIGLVALGVGIPVLIGAVAGSLEVPRNDDWVYRKMTLDFARTGVLVLNVKAMVVGQIILTQPLLWLSASRPWAFAVAGILFAACAVLSAYALARQFLPPLRATVAVALLLLFPGYLAYATSFMTDVPALAAQFSCLAMGAVALRRRPVRDRWLVASVVVGCVGISLRDFAVAAPAAVLAATICAHPRRYRYWGLAAGVAACYGLLYLLRIALYPKDQTIVITAPGGFFQSLQAMAILSLVLVPAVLIGAVRWHRHWQRRDLVVGAELGVLLAGVRLLQWYQQGTMPLAILPNLASQWGAPQREMFLGDRPLLFGDATWAVVNVLALAAGVPLLAACVGIAGVYVRGSGRRPAQLLRRLGSPVGSLTLFILAVAGGQTVYALFTPVFDRYFWPLVPPIAILLMYGAGSSAMSTETWSRPVRQAATALTMLAVGALAAVSMVFALNSNAFDAALWRAGETLTGLGIRSDEIDAGYAWVAYYASTPISGGGSGTVAYRQYWPAFRECGFVTSTNGGRPGAVLVGSTSYSLLLIGGPTEPLYLFRDTAPGCRTP